MKEIATRLHENRQIELAKSILESNGYKVSKRVKESKPSMTKESQNTQYGVHQFSTDSIIFRGTEEECGRYIDKRKDLWDDAEIYMMTPDDPHYIKESHGYKVSKRSESIRESSTGDWIHWEMPADYEGPFEYPHYYKKYSEDVIGYVYLPYKSSNPDRVDSISGYRADLYDNRKTDSIAQKNFRTLKAAQNYLDQMYKQHSGYKVSK